MPRFAANLTTMYREHDFLDRFAAAVKDGFTAVEYMFPYEYPAETLRGLLQEHGLRQVLFNAPAGDWNKGDRGTTSIPGREAEFREGFERAIDYAQVLECPRIHAMAGVMPGDGDRRRFRATYLDNVGWAAEKASEAGLDLLVEPIAQRNMPGFFLNRQDEAHAIVDEIGRPNLRVMFDLFHCQVEEGDLATKIRKYMNEKPCRVGHMQIAGVPDRHEPNIGEVNYAYLFDVIDESGYTGWVGLEYIPLAGTSEGLEWLENRG
jgi:2-dehydrotetronate isomerase